jgi:hypothetical protein
MSLYSSSNGQLAKNLPYIAFIVLKLRTSLNNGIADYAKALHGDKTTFFKAKVSHNCEVSFKTIENLVS